MPWDGHVHFDYTSVWGRGAVMSTCIQWVNLQGVNL